MKTIKHRKIVALVTGVSSLAALTLMAGSVGVIVRVPAPAVTVQVPVPAVTVAAYPDYYVWDGYEYVGVVGSDYYYLGPGGVWIMCDPVRLGRFHGWERGHADWHAHAIHNEHYRHGGHEHDHDRH